MLQPLENIYYNTYGHTAIPLNSIRCIWPRAPHHLGEQWANAKGRATTERPFHQCAMSTTFTICSIAHVQLSPIDPCRGKQHTIHIGTCVCVCVRRTTFNGVDIEFRFCDFQINYIQRCPAHHLSVCVCELDHFPYFFVVVVRKMFIYENRTDRILFRMNKLNMENDLSVRSDSIRFQCKLLEWNYV